MSTDPQDLLRNRYGAPRRERRMGPRGWLGVVLLGTLVAAVFVVWVVNGQQKAPAYKDVSYEVVSGALATADFDLTKQPDDVVTCAVHALNEGYAVVGWKEVTVGSVPEDRLGAGGTSSHRVALRTTNLATTAVVDSCWVVDGPPRER